MAEERRYGQRRCRCAEDLAKLRLMGMMTRCAGVDGRDHGYINNTLRCSGGVEDEMGWFERKRRKSWRDVYRLVFFDGNEYWISLQA